MPMLWVVGSGICDAWRGFGLGDAGVLGVGWRISAAEE